MSSNSTSLRSSTSFRTLTASAMISGPIPSPSSSATLYLLMLFPVWICVEWVRKPRNLARRPLVGQGEGPGAGQGDAGQAGAGSVGRTFARKALPQRLLGLHKLECHTVALADGHIFRAIGIAQTQVRRQGPDAAGVVLGVTRIGIDLGGGDQLEAGFLG